MFEKIIQKPKMTQKLLEKPPFRYLHDIFTSTMETTGFAQGLYEEQELDSKLMNERDQKVNFLGKMVALVEFMTNEKLDVKPAKIVAGLEPEKTNEFLQSMFRAATSGVDSLPYVKQILGVEEDEGEEGDDGGAQEQARQ